MKHRLQRRTTEHPVDPLALGWLYQRLPYHLADQMVRGEVAGYEPSVIARHMTLFIFAELEKLGLKAEDPF